MKSADLELVFAAAQSAMGDHHHDELVAAGVDRADIDMGLVGVMRGHVRGDRLEIDPTGGQAYITPVRTHYPTLFESPIPDSAVRVGDLIDAVAWHPKFPRRWATLTGNAEALGLVEPQYCAPEPVEIWRGPLAWFKHGCRGLVLLSRQPSDVYRTLSLCAGGLVAEDDRHAEELRAALEHPWPRPKILVREGRQVRRAA